MITGIYLITMMRVVLGCLAIGGFLYMMITDGKYNGKEKELKIRETNTGPIFGEFHAANEPEIRKAA